MTINRKKNGHNYKVISNIFESIVFNIKSQLFILIKHNEFEYHGDNDTYINNDFIILL